MQLWANAQVGTWLLLFTFLKEESIEEALKPMVQNICELNLSCAETTKTCNESEYV